jgi:hypothetical protein
MTSCHAAEATSRWPAERPRARPVLADRSLAIEPRNGRFSVDDSANGRGVKYEGPTRQVVGYVGFVLTTLFVFSSRPGQLAARAKP